MPAMTGHVISRAGRSLYENAYLNLVATGVVAAAVLLVGIFLTVMFNLNALVEGWQQDVHVSAYFHPDIPVERRFELRDDIAAMPEVEAVRYFSEDDARAFLGEKVPEVRPVLENLGAHVLPASLEITLRQGFTRPDAIRAFADRITLAEFDSLDYGQQWVERFNSFLSILKLLGLVLGGLIALSAVFLVANTINLVVYSRRQELEITWLVGGTSAFVAIPFLVEGFVQGLVGSLLALGGIVLIHKSVVVRLQSALSLSLVEEPLRMLPWDKMALLLLLGVVFGVAGCGVAVWRFLRKVP
jgi:cell division transport system permease protein